MKSEESFSEGLTPSEIWKIKDDIKYGRLIFNIGDIAILFFKKKGYPKNLKIGDFGIVVGVEINHVIVEFHSILIKPRIKLPKKLLVEKVYMRELKLRKLLGD